METVLKAIADWIKGILTAGIMSNLSGLFDDVNTQVGNIAQQVGTKPSNFEPRVFAMIEALSRNVVLPIAGIILTFIACYELIEMITQHNNMAQFEPALIMRWIRDIPVPLNVRPCAIKLRDTTDQFIWESPKTGLPCNPTHFRDVFRKSLEEAGDVRLLTPHSCRHTYVSQMQALGVDIQTIQSIVGHADTEMTEHYLHVQESIRQSAIQLFSEAFSA